MDCDILIVGAGIVGCALARVLSRYEAGVLVLEAGPDVASGSTRANSGIVHAGYDAVPGTLKAILGAEGAAMYPALSAELGVPFRQCGAMVLAFSDADRQTLRALLSRGRQNGVPGLRLVGREDILRLEPNTNPDVREALLAPTSGIVSPYEAAYALADHAALNGVRFLFDHPVQSLARRGDGLFCADTPGGSFAARAVVNCAGLGSAALHNLLSPRQLTLVPRRGQYHLLDRRSPLPFSHTMFQCPSRMGKGVLVSPTVHGNLLLGPSAEDIPDPFDTSTTADGLASVLEACRLTWPQANLRDVITSFAGVRAHEPGGDFIIGPVEGCPGAYETVGVESPGLSAASAIGERLGRRIAQDLGLPQKALTVPLRLPKPFREQTDEEKAAAIRENPEHGCVICRCECVTEADIREAVRRPVGARSVDGVKRRTRAGMGRCQGGFCGPRVASILSEELSIPLDLVTKNGGASRLLTGALRAPAGNAEEGSGHAESHE